MKIAPLKPGRTSLVEQAKNRNVLVPTGKTVKELRAAGWDTDPDWPDYAVVMVAADSPTSIAVVWQPQQAAYSLAT
jgi:hypothetical protein